MKVQARVHESTGTYNQVVGGFFFLEIDSFWGLRFRVSLPLPTFKKSATCLKYISYELFV